MKEKSNDTSAPPKVIYLEVKMNGFEVPKRLMKELKKMDSYKCNSFDLFEEHRKYILEHGMSTMLISNHY